MPTHYGHGEDLSEQELIDRATQAERESLRKSLEAQNKLNNERYKRVTNPQNPGDKLQPGEGIDTGELDEYGKPVYESQQESIHWSGWPLKALQKVGEGFDWIDKQAGIGEFNVYNARRKILDPLSETHFALGLLGEIFLPDTVDIATAGLSYIPNRFRKLGKAGAKMWAKITAIAIPTASRTQTIADWNDNLKGLEAVARMEGKSLEQVLAETGQVSYIKKDLDNFGDTTTYGKSLNTSRKLTGRQRRINFRDDFVTRAWKNWRGPDPQLITQKNWKSDDIILDGANREGVLNQLALSINKNGINPNDLGIDLRKIKNAGVPDDIGNLYMNYVEQYYKKWDTLDDIDELKLPDGTTAIDLNKKKKDVIRRRVQSTAENPDPDLGPAFYSQDTKPEIVASITANKGLNTEAGEVINLQAHHISGLADAYYLFKDLENVEAKKVTDYLAKEWSVFSGDSLGNRAMLDHMGVHNPLHKWMIDNAPDVSDELAAKIAKIKTFEGRKKYIDEYAESVNRSQEEIYKRVQTWIQKNFKDDPAADRWDYLMSKSDRELDNLFKYLEAPSPELLEALSPEAVEQLSALDRYGEIFAGWKGTFPPKTKDLEPPGRGKTIPKSG